MFFCGQRVRFEFNLLGTAVANAPQRVSPSNRQGDKPPDRDSARSYDIVGEGSIDHQC
jgi:hypothetical protein